MTIAHEREELEAALAHAEAAQQFLEAQLVMAEQMLVTTVNDIGSIDANREMASANLEAARIRCRHLRAALRDPIRTQTIARSRERVEGLVNGSDARLNKVSACSTSRGETAERVIRTEGLTSSWQPKVVQQFRKILGCAPPLREVVGLSALVLSYLQYYFMDVELQIALLPSITLIALR